MASGLSSSSMLFFGKRNEENQVNQAMNIQQDTHIAPLAQPHIIPPKKRRNPLGVPYEDAEIIALSPTTLMATNRFVCEVCHKGFPREQNLQLHKRGHNLPWKLKQRTTDDVVKRKVYLCPEPSCINHEPSHALGDLTGIKKHYSRKHGEKKYKCQKCSKMYAVQSDLKAHSKNCGMKEYQCDCGTLFSRRDSFITHRAFCDALAQEGVAREPPTLRAMGVGSFKSSSNNNHNSQTSVPQLGSQAPSIQNQTHTLSVSAQGVSHLGHVRAGNNSHMIRPSMDMNQHTPSPALFMPSSYQHHQHRFLERFDTRIFTNLVHNTTNTLSNNMELYNLGCMGNGGNYGSGEGSSLLSGGGIMSDHSASLYSSPSRGTMPQLSATALLQTAALLGSTSSNNNPANFVRGYASSSSSGPVGGILSEKNQLLFGSGHFGSDNNGLDSNMNELINSFSSRGVGTSMANRYAGAGYEQEDNYRVCLDSGNRVYDDGWKAYNFEEQQPSPDTHSNMGFQRSGGVMLTRDFLGVGGEMLGNISSDEPESSFGGGRFL